jgi:CelD/BcsL family acetyltransferase involved in cellulose biosynthesis
MYEVRCWSESQWLSAAGRQAWNELIAASGADRLFSSWDWQTLWWQNFGRDIAEDLRIHAFYRDGELVGLAPFYCSRQRRKRLLWSRSVQLLGIHFRNPHALISEYLGLIARPAHADALYAECIRQLMTSDDWNELIIGCTRDASMWRQAIDTIAAERTGYARIVDSVTSYQADLSGGFDNYLALLGQSTRRASWGLRRRLEPLVDVVDAACKLVDSADIESAFHDLNRLHLARWGAPAFSGRRLQFHLELAQRLQQAGSLQLRRMRGRQGNAVVGVLYDVRLQGWQYNIQSGFDPGFATRLSLGLLQFGYVMQEAAAAGVTTYDFLAGHGQRTNYKVHLAQRAVELSSLQYLRGPLLSTLYRWHDRPRTRQGRA